jgi:predicted RNA binding protein YcfA (HicA-like mRNA interferase family)
MRSPKRLLQIWKTLPGWIARFSQRLGNIPSLIYVASYVFLIFAFSYIYYVLPGRPFFHSTAQYEYESLNLDATNLLSRLRERILKNLNLTYKSDKPNIRGWLLDTRSIDVNSLSVRNFPEEFSFVVTAPLTRLDPKGLVFVYTHWLVTAPLKDKVVSGGIVYLFPKSTDPTPMLSLGLATEPNLQELLPRTGETPSTAPVLVLPVDLYNDIVGFGQGYRGFPSKVRGHYLRMLYFSSGVATSTALGDIVPITSTARLLVTVEALASLILVGLFLNALATGIGSRREAPRHETVLGDVSIREVLRRIEDDGWKLVLTTGNHRQFRHSAKPGSVLVSGKEGLDVPPDTLNSIFKQAGLKR